MASEQDGISLNHAKRRRMLSKTHKPEEDRISSLPDDVIVEILSRLDETKFAIRTGTLSKRWPRLWPQLSNLLIKDTFDYYFPRFYASLERILLETLTPPQINKFKLHTFYTNKTHTQVTDCIRSAILRNVQEIDFDIPHYYRNFGSNRYDGFVLPDFFFICSSFTRVRLCRCLFEQAGVVSWENLRTLHIEEAELDKDMIENILSGSPLLETLELTRCYGFERIDITTNKSVKNLGLSLCGSKQPIQISAPYILTLAIKEDLMYNHFMLLNVSSLINVELDICKEKFDVQETDKERVIAEEILKGHLLNIVHAKEVKLGQLCLEALARLQAKGFIIPSNLRVIGDIALG